MEMTKQEERRKRGEDKEKRDMRKRVGGREARDMIYGHLVSRRYYSYEDVKLASA